MPAFNTLAYSTRQDFYEILNTVNEEQWQVVEEAVALIKVWSNQDNRVFKNNNVVETSAYSG